MNVKAYYMEKTIEYYSEWLGERGILAQPFTGIKFIYSKERNEVQYGYGQPFDIYIFAMQNKAVVSYGDKAKPQIENFKQHAANCKTVEDLKLALETVYGTTVEHNFKYVFNGTPAENNTAKVLGKDDYKEYESFFKKCNPRCSNIDWLQEYFEEMIAENLCVGAFENDVMVSCTDAPGMPYMANAVQETGINTLPEYRGKGYATVACLGNIAEILKNGKVPQWSTTSTNTASQKLAEKIGFIKLADVIATTL